MTKMIKSKYTTSYRFSFLKVTSLSFKFHFNNSYQLQADLNNKHNRRLDHLVSVLLKIARDNAFRQFLKLNKGKTTHRVSEINKRYRRAEESTTKIKRLKQKIWTIESQKQKGTECTVQRISDCTTCKLRCSYCNACIHMYTCTCLDCVTHTTVC